MEKNQSEYGRIGGSIVSAIIGHNPWETPLSAYLKLRKEVSPTPDNPAMERGRRLEPVVATMFAGCHPEYDVRNNRKGTEEPEEYIDEEHPFLVAHPDRLLYDKNGKLVAGLEIKTANVANSKAWGTENTDSIPMNYLIQCQWYAGLAKIPEWLVAVAFVDDFGKIRFYREYKVVADNELYNALRGFAIKFWRENVLEGVAPVMDKVNDTMKRWLVEKYPANTQSIGVATQEEEQLMARLIESKDALEKAKQKYELYETKVKQAIGDRDGIMSETFGKVTWKVSKPSSRVDYKAVCDELNPPMELLKKHTTEVQGSRRFVTSGMKVTL